MKKIKVILTILLITIIVTSCATVNNEEKGMYVKPHEFSVETNKIVGLLKAKIQCWDFAADKDTKYYEFKLSYYENGKWEDIKMISSIEDDKKFKVGFSQKDGKYSLISFSENGEGVNETDKVFDFSDMSIVSQSALDTMQDIEKNKEIVLYSKYAVKGEDGALSEESNDYKKVKCDKAVVFTLKLGDKEIE